MKCIKKYKIFKRLNAHWLLKSCFFLGHIFKICTGAYVNTANFSGLKEAEDEVEKFVQSNTQEVAKDKWQCPLCGKKFKAAEFVHKHILHKHAEKVKEVKKEVIKCTL